MIKHLSNLNSTQRYQLQCLLLNHITKKTYELNNKTKVFWKYDKDDKESWKSYYANERALKKAFSALFDVINSIRKIKNIYDETLKRIVTLWESTKEMFARDQFVQMLKSMRRCALRNMSMKNARHVVNLIIKNRLKNLSREVSISSKFVNRDWIRVTIEEYDSRQIESVTRFNFQLTTLSSSLSFVVIMSSFLTSRLKEEKKNRRTILVVLFFSNFLSLTKKKRNRKSIFVVFFLSRMWSFVKRKKNRKTIFVVLFLERNSSFFSLTSSLIILEFSFAAQSFSSLSSFALKI
jgi:hypothetical protein